MNIEPDQVNEWLKDAIPAGCVGKPDEIASLIAYLCSDLAGYVSGEWIVVDSGKHRFAF